LTGLPALPAGNYNITHRRIYRLNTGSTGVTNFQFLTEVAVTLAQVDITNITQANPTVITTATDHSFSDGQEILLTGLGTEATQVIEGVTKANPVRITITGHGFVTGKSVEIAGLGGGNGMDELDGVRAALIVINVDKFELPSIDSSAFVAWVAGGTAAPVTGMDELDDKSHFITVIDEDNFSLLGLDSTGFFPYIGDGVAAQIAGTSYVDAVPSESLAEVLPTELYDPPNPATVGVKVHPAGFLVGFFGNTLVFSEPGAPHAWPIDYRLVTTSDIVGVGVFGGTIAVVTEGWPYLVLGSDPAALSMVELEIEQACVAKRGIVDFGTAIAYPSPDGLIIISSRGATNATAALFNRDQWQALVPTSFVAFNWEQQYLCFYDDGTTQRGFILDPFGPEGGVRYLTKYATGGYKDIEEDLIYFIDSNQIESWDQSTTKLPFTWKSRPTFTPRAVNMAACKIIADEYPVNLELFVDSIKRFTKTVGSIEAFRLPGGFKGEKFEVVIKGTRRVSEVALATTMGELSVTV